MAARLPPDSVGTQSIRKYAADGVRALHRRIFNRMLEWNEGGHTLLWTGDKIGTWIGAWAHPLGGARCRRGMISYMECPYFEVRHKGEAYAQYHWKVVGHLLNAALQLGRSSGWCENVPLYTCGGVPA